MKLRFQVRLLFIFSFTVFFEPIQNLQWVQIVLFIVSRFLFLARLRQVQLVVIANWRIGTPPVFILFPGCNFRESFFNFAPTNLLILKILTLAGWLAFTKACHRSLETPLAPFKVFKLCLMKYPINFFPHFSSFPVSVLCPQGRVVFDAVYLQTPYLNCCSSSMILLFII